eukprot:6211819-Pleurochrysis_carterae.AAC.1
MPLVGGADLNGTASGDPTSLRFDRPNRASPTGLFKCFQVHRSSCYNTEHAQTDLSVSGTRPRASYN